MWRLAAAGNKEGRVAAPQRHCTLVKCMSSLELVAHPQVESVVIGRAALAMNVRLKYHVFMRPVIDADDGLNVFGIAAATRRVVPDVVTRIHTDQRNDLVGRLDVPAALFVATHRGRSAAVEIPCGI